MQSALSVIPIYRLFILWLILRPTHPLTANLHFYWYNNLNPRLGF